MVDQADLPARAEARGKHVADVIGFAQEHALFAIAGQYQGVQLDGRRGRWHGGEGGIEQAALGQYADLQWVGQQLAIGVAHAHAVDPGAGLHGAVGEHQGAFALIAVAVETADIETAVGEVQAAFAAEAPFAELAHVVAAVHADQLAFAAERAFLELADPHVAVGVFITALAVELVLFELADIDIAVGTVEGAIAFKLAVDKTAAELVAAVVVALAFAVGFAVHELALVLAAVGQLQAAKAGILIVFEFAAIGHLPLFEGAFAVASPVLETADVAAARRGQAAMAVEQALLELAFVDLAVAAMPFALAVPLAFVELAGVPTAVGVVHAALALQQTVDHITPITAAVGQARIGR
ncbi:hypothetical protein [Pseudomonas sp. 22 E 5]|nr:hypothetical protein [Pseudomonas sp. 22 E 5]